MVKTMIHICADIPSRGNLTVELEAVDLDDLLASFLSVKFFDRQQFSHELIAERVGTADVVKIQRHPGQVLRVMPVEYFKRIPG